MDSSAFQSRVSDDCGHGSAIRSIGADGGVTCEVDDSGSTTYSAGFGLSLTGTTFGINPAQTQRRLVEGCAVGSSIRAIAEDGTVTCEQDAGHGWTIRTTTHPGLAENRIGVRRAFCPRGYFSTGGGVDVGPDNADAFINDSFPVSEGDLYGWQGVVTNYPNNGAAASFTVYVICAPGG